MYNTAKIEKKITANVMKKLDVLILKAIKTIKLNNRMTIHDIVNDPDNKKK